MKVLVAGATGAIGRSLIKRLRLAGHTIFGMVRSQSSSEPLSNLGAEPVIADALDASSMRAAMVKVRPDVIINELTSLPKHYTPTEMKAAAERDARVRVEGNKNLIAAAQQTGVRRFLLNPPDSGMHQAGILLTKANASPTAPPRQSPRVYSATRSSRP